MKVVDGFICSTVHSYISNQPKTTGAWGGGEQTLVSFEFEPSIIFWVGVVDFDVWAHSLMVVVVVFSSRWGVVVASQCRFILYFLGREKHGLTRVQRCHGGLLTCCHYYCSQERWVFLEQMGSVRQTDKTEILLLKRAAHSVAMIMCLPS